MTTHRPSPVGAALSVLTAAVAVALVATTPSQRTSLAVALVGVTLTVAGLELFRRGHLLVGVLVAVAGTGTAAAAVGLGVARSPAFSTTVELVPGLIGLYVLGLAFGPVRRGRERLVLSVGAGLVFLAVVVSGAVYGAPTGTLLVAGVAVVLAWDLGERAINVGEQLGREARSWPVQLAHGGATAAACGVGVGATLLVSGVGVSNLPLSALAVLLTAAFTLTAALSH